MQVGYLAVETHHDRPGLVRLFVSARAIDPEPTVHATRRVRYVARFNDSEAALMHAHELLRRRLVDVDAGLYRAPCEQAIAAVESIGLSHRRIYLDPDLDAATRTTIEQAVERLSAARRRRDLAFDYVGYAGLALLLFNLLLSLG